MNKQEWRAGIIAGIPIALGYLSVSFGVGIMAVQAGMSVLQAAILSLTNLTSAGQAAGIEVIAAGGSLIEIALTQLVINMRYALMGLSLTQKTNNEFGTPQRMLASFGITDEIFAMAAGRDRDISPQYMYGMILIATLGWTAGTALGAAAGALLPAVLTEALGIMLYGMFIAVCVPAGKKDHVLIIVMAIAIAFSVLFRFVFTAVTSGFAVIISALAAAIIGALLFPIPEEEEGEQS